MPPKKGNSRASSPPETTVVEATSSETPLVVNDTPAEALSVDPLAALGDMMRRNQELEEQVPQLMSACVAFTETAEAQKGRADRLVKETDELKATHKAAMDENEKKLKSVEVEIDELRANAEHTDKEKDQALAKLRAEKEALEAEKTAVQKKHDDLVNSLAQFQITEEQKKEHAKMNDRVKEILTGSAAALKKAREGLPTA